MPKERPDEEAVTRMIAKYLARVDAPEYLAEEFSMGLRAARMYRTVSEEVAGEPDVVAQDELREILQEALVPDATDLLEAARLDGEVKRRIFAEQLLTSSQASAVLGTRSHSNRRQYANNLRAGGSLLGIPHRRNSYLYPAFQFDVRRVRVRPVVEQVNRLLDAQGDPWGVASWWITPSERIGGRAPKDLLGTGEEHLVAELAKADLEPIG